MSAVLVLTLIAACVSPGMSAAQDTTDEAVALYLDLRDRLAPAEVASRKGLQSALSRADTSSVELCGDVSGLAYSAAELESGFPRTMMLTLDDGSSVALRAGDDVDGLRVGDRVAVIASVVRNAPMTRELVVEAWVLEWDLPTAMQPPQPAALEVPTPDHAPVLPPSSGNAFPSPGADQTCRADAVDTWKAWVLKHNPKLSDEQATDIVTWVLHYAQVYNVNHKLIFALIKWESWFDPSCRSHAGAIGLMQLMPGTARHLGVNPWNVQQNIEGGVRYLAEQLETYRDRPTYERVILALACYNAGPNAVARAGDRVPSIAETQRYVRKVSATFLELCQSDMP